MRRPFGSRPVQYRPRRGRQQAPLTPWNHLDRGMIAENPSRYRQRTMLSRADLLSVPFAPVEWCPRPRLRQCANMLRRKWPNLRVCPPDSPMEKRVLSRADYRLPTTTQSRRLNRRSQQRSHDPCAAKLPCVLQRDLTVKVVLRQRSSQRQRPQHQNEIRTQHLLLTESVVRTAKQRPGPSRLVPA